MEFQDRAGEHKMEARCVSMCPCWCFRIHSWGFYLTHRLLSTQHSQTEIPTLLHPQVTWWQISFQHRNPGETHSNPIQTTTFLQANVSLCPVLVHQVPIFWIRLRNLQKVTPSFHNRQGWARPQPGAGNWNQVSQVGGRDSSTWAMTHCLPEWASAGAGVMGSLVGT